MQMTEPQRRDEERGGTDPTSDRAAREASTERSDEMEEADVANGEGDPAGAPDRSQR
jgi:hypothetical protein